MFFKLGEGAVLVDLYELIIIVSYFNNSALNKD